MVRLKNRVLVGVTCQVAALIANQPEEWHEKQEKKL